MTNSTCKSFGLDVLIAMSIHEKQALFSLKNQRLYINNAPNNTQSIKWSKAMLDSRSDFFLEKNGLQGVELSLLGKLWKEALSQNDLTCSQLKDIGLKQISTPKIINGEIKRWRKMIDARLKPIISDIDYIEHLPLSEVQKKQQPLELGPLLKTWPERLLEHPEWSCAEPPLPDIPPLPLDDIWVDLLMGEPPEDNNVDDDIFPYALEQRYIERQWLNTPIDFILESLKDTMVLIGAPGIGKTTLLKWIARQLIKEPDGRFILPLFVPLRAYALSKSKKPKLNLLKHALITCGIELDQQLTIWAKVIQYLSGSDRNSVLFLLDGWDEVPSEMRETFINEIRELGYRYSIVITTRPSAYPKALSASQFFEISDLSPESITILIQKWHRILNKSEQVDVLLTHLKVHKDLSQLARNPFLLNLLCAINIKDSMGQNNLPCNRTELYTSTLNHIYNYHSKKYSSLAFESHHITKTQQFALWLMSEAPNYPQYIFGAHEIEQITNDNDLPIMLNYSRLVNHWHIDKESLHFLHATFQEYLAAEALNILEEDKRNDLITKEINNPAWQEILRFMAGQNSNTKHAYWKIIRQQAITPDLSGLIDIRLSKLIAEAGSIDGGQALLGFDLRDRLWEHIKKGIGIDYFVRAYNQLDSKDYVFRVKHSKTIKSKALRTQLIRSLKAIRSREASQTLIDALLSENEHDASVASYAIKDVIDAEGMQTLRSKLLEKQLSVNTKKFLTRAIGNCKDYLSIPFLTQLYKNSIELRKDIIHALGSIGGQEAATTLQKYLLNSSNYENQLDIVRALSRAFDLPSRDILITELAKTEPDAPLLAEILDGLCEIPLSRHSNLISLYINSEYPENIRVSAIWALMEASESHITEELAYLAESDLSEKVRIAALAAMANRARNIDMPWLIARVNNTKCKTQERANALKATLTYYSRVSHEQDKSSSKNSTIHRQVLEMTKNALDQKSTDLNIEAATHAYLLGEDIAPTLLEVTKKTEIFSTSAREAACTSLGKLGYKPALEFFNKLLEKTPYIVNDEERPVVDENERISRIVAEAYVRIDLKKAAQHNSPGVQAEVRLHALEYGYLIYPDKIITPSGKVLEHQKVDESKDLYPKLNKNLIANDQTYQLREVCHYLLSQGYAKKSGLMNDDKIPLFRKTNYTSEIQTDSIDANTGRKFLNGQDINPNKAQKLMEWINNKFPWVFF